MKITAAEARAYFAHPSQQVLGATPETVPDEGLEYWADGPVCLIFHETAHPDVWMVHLAVKPDGWGHLVEPTRRLLAEFWQAKQPRHIAAWIEEHRTAAIAFARKVGLTEDGRFPGTVMLGWSGTWAD